MLERPKKFPAIQVLAEACREVRGKTDKSKLYYIQNMYIYPEASTIHPEKFEQFVTSPYAPGNYHLDAGKSLVVRDRKLIVDRLQLVPEVAVAAVPGGAAASR